MLVTCSEAIRRSHTTQVPIQNENSWKSWFLRFSGVFNDNVNVQIFGKGAELFPGGFPAESFQKCIPLSGELPVAGSTCQRNFRADRATAAERQA